MLIRLWKTNKPILLLTMPAVLWILALIPTLLLSYQPVTDLFPSYAISAFFDRVLIGLTAGYPFLLTALNLYYLICRRPLMHSAGWTEVLTEWISVLLGLFFSLIYIGLSNIMFMDWDQVLVNAQIHTPVATFAVPTLLVFFGTGTAGYLILRFFKQTTTRPPLVTVLSMSALYLAMSLCLLLIIQLMGKPEHFLLTLLPGNCILIGSKLIKTAVLEWQTQIPPASGNRHLEKLPRLRLALSQAAGWPVLALLLALPLLALLLIILLLFGQSPDSVIRAFTDTSQWALSQKVSPVNLTYDEHYLCTVAAGGHKKLVKPQRLGKRHGHTVIVNRQLCIANAFEQLLSERLPRAHRHIRKTYDTYGYPIARHIHSPMAADLIYLLMKPAEWIFLICLYLFDAKPEDRIAVQYLWDESLQTARSK